MNYKHNYHNAVGINVAVGNCNVFIYFNTTTRSNFLTLVNEFNSIKMLLTLTIIKYNVIIKYMNYLII